MTTHSQQMLELAQQGATQGELELLRNENYRLKQEIGKMATRLAELEQKLYAKAFNKHAMYVAGVKND